MLSDATKLFISPYTNILVLFLYKAAENTLQPTVRVHIYHQVCKSEGLSEGDCSARENRSNNMIGDTWHRLGRSLTEEEQTSVQRRASMYLLAYYLLLCLPAVFFSLFAGSWSERVGRKPPMLLPPLGTILAALCFAFSVCVSRRGDAVVALAIVMLGGALNGLCGYSSLMLMACCSYASETSCRQDRTGAIGFLLAMNFLGRFLGSLLSGLLQSLGVVTNFRYAIPIIVIAASLLAELIIVLLIRESVETARNASCLQRVCPCSDDGSKPAGTRSKWSISDSVGFILNRRPQRQVIVFIFVALWVNQLCKQGERDVILLLVEHYPFNWPGHYYGYYLAVHYASMGIGLLAVVTLLTKFLQPRDSSLVVFGLLVKVGRLVIAALAQTTWLMFAGAALSFSDGFIVSASKSMLSKLVDAGEVSQTFSLLSGVEALAGLLGPLIFTPLYAATVNAFPGLILIADAGLQLCLAMGLLAIYVSGIEDEFAADDRVAKAKPSIGDDGLAVATDLRKKSPFEKPKGTRNTARSDSLSTVGSQVVDAKEVEASSVADSRASKADDGKAEYQYGQRN